MCDQGGSAIWPDEKSEIVLFPVIMSKCRVPTALVTQNSIYFPGKCNEIPGQFGFESVFVWIILICQRRKSEFFENDILKSES